MEHAEMKKAQGRMGGVVFGLILLMADDVANDESDGTSFERRAA